MTSPLVSIIITNYNYARFLANCIKSCLNQEGSISYEIILVDDGSTDNSLRIAESFKDKRLKIIKRKNGGIEAASNEGIYNSNAEYIVRVDADDYLMPEYLYNIINNARNTNYDFAYSNYQIVDEYGRIQSLEKLPLFSKREIFERGDFLATGTLYKREVILEHGGYSEETPNCGLENYELVLKLLKSGCAGIHIDQNLFSYRIHGNNISTKRRENIINYGQKLFKSLSIGHYATNSYHPYKLIIK